LPFYAIVMSWVILVIIVVRFLMGGASDKLR
jgi:hypothetical protein